jgi:transposase-like protein
MKNMLEREKKMVRMNNKIENIHRQQKRKKKQYKKIKHG